LYGTPIEGGDRDVGIRSSAGRDVAADADARLATVLLFIIVHRS
jgi:hypothetical protein